MGGGWALDFESFLGPVKWHRADRRVPFRTIVTSALVVRFVIFGGFFIAKIQQTFIGFFDEQHSG